MLHGMDAREICLYTSLLMDIMADGLHKAVKDIYRGDFLWLFLISFG